MGRYAKFWDGLHRKFDTGSAPCENFLDEYIDIWQDKGLPAVDLACGSGANSLYLQNRGIPVYACDYSQTALDIVKRDIPSVSTLCFDMTEGISLPKESTNLVVCDMGLHFFSEEETAFIL